MRRPASGPTLSASTIDCRVIGPDSAADDCLEFARLLPSLPLSEQRQGRLASCSKMTVKCGARLVGVAAYTVDDGRLEVHELGVDSSGACDAPNIALMLFQALESACLAAGGSTVRISGISPAAAEWAAALGYVAAGGNGRPTTHEKTLA